MPMDIIILFTIAKNCLVQKNYNLNMLYKNFPYPNPTLPYALLTLTLPYPTPSVP
jgi:hypothetical protein